MAVYGQSSASPLFAAGKRYVQSGFTDGDDFRRLVSESTAGVAVRYHPDARHGDPDQARQDVLEKILSVKSRLSAWLPLGPDRFEARIVQVAKDHCLSTALHAAGKRYVDSGFTDGDDFWLFVIESTAGVARRNHPDAWQGNLDEPRQDIVEKILSVKGRLNDWLPLGPDLFEAHIRTVARNHCIDIARGRRRIREGPLPDDEVLGEGAAAAPDAVDRLCALEFALADLGTDACPVHLPEGLCLLPDLIREHVLALLASGNQDAFPEERDRLKKELRSVGIPNWKIVDKGYPCLEWWFYRGYSVIDQFSIESYRDATPQPRDWPDGWQDPEGDMRGQSRIVAERISVARYLVLRRLRLKNGRWNRDTYPQVGAIHIFERYADLRGLMEMHMSDVAAFLKHRAAGDREVGL